ncbi:serine/threonine-protein kinase [Tautonia sociabilis]|uniref:non-specific serine/threonine protein kinase n=1 Tax=Tautonia sociabilis TaxID=2080755 RepID=A0A432MJ56_9BACT|nr:serine/threonine-protein kinase [Tautonia sociabilis]RUL87228.1 serine/threonine protein kinase [Tautonia sociabilis]
MPVTVRCPNPSCGRIHRFDDTLAGQAVRCPVCGERNTIAAETELASAADREVRPGSGRSGSSETLELTTLAEGAEARSRPEESLPLGVGRYRIKREIGRGAFGAVYRAYDPQLDRDVALKVPHAGVLEAPSAIERFLREARAAGKLRHGHIVPVFDAGKDDEGRYYIASAYVPGSTLADLLAEGPLPARRAAEIARDLAEALDHAHELGIVHRDVKPSNVLIDAAGEVLLADFGLAQHRGPSSTTITEVGTIMGTPGYMAPEVAAGIQGDVPPACDQYSLGVVLFELLCGHRPFQGPSHVVIYRKIESDPPSPRHFRPDLSPALETICLRALSRRPEDRYSTIGDFASALSRWLESGDAPPAEAEPPAGDSAPQPGRASPAPAPPSPPGGSSGLSEPSQVRRKSAPRLSTPVRMAMISMAVWGIITIAVILLIRLLMPDL